MLYIAQLCEAAAHIIILMNCALGIVQCPTYAVLQDGFALGQVGKTTDLESFSLLQ